MEESHVTKLGGAFTKINVCVTAGGWCVRARARARVAAAAAAGEEGGWVGVSRQHVVVRAIGGAMI